MPISRRDLLLDLGVGAVAAAALPALAAGDPAGLARSLSPTVDPATPIRLDRNENPYGPSESVTSAMRDSLASVNRYPRSAEVLRQKIAASHKVKAEQVVLGNGSDDVLRMVADAFLRPGKNLVVATPTYPRLASYALQREAEVIEVPLRGDRRHDLDEMLARCDSSTGLVYICNPNNPTGTVTVRKDIDEFLRALPPSIPVVIDEAYHHYVPLGPSYASFIDRPPIDRPPIDRPPIDRPTEDERTIVTRTFSAIYGLAGLRIGYAVVPLALAPRLSRFSLEFGENSVAIAAAIAALDDTDHVRRSAQVNADERQRFVNHANVRYAPVSGSETNFVLVELDHPIEKVMAHFLENGVLVGPRFPNLDQYLRVSIGRPEEMAVFWQVWDMLPHAMHH